MHNETTFNGWANRETWAAALHLSNDLALYDHVHDLAVDALAEARIELGDPTVDPDAIRRVGADAAALALNRCANRLADCVESWALDARDAALGGAPLPTTIVLMLDEIGSRWRVDWRAVAASYVDDAAELAFDV